MKLTVSLMESKMDDVFQQETSANANDSLLFVETAVSAPNSDIPSGISANNVNNISGRLPSPQTLSGGNFGGFNFSPPLPVPTSGWGPALPSQFTSPPIQPVEDFKPDSPESVSCHE
jgi:hypothetical protein